MTDGAHASMLRGAVESDFDDLRTQGRDATIIAGAFRRSLEAVPSKLIADTSTRAVTVQTPTLFCDLRISAARPVLQEGIASFDELPIATLASLVCTTHCFAGYSLVDLDGSSLCSRLHAFDWQPMPRLRANRWRIQPQFDEGGWVEWSARLDVHGQSEYVEHWRTLSSSREGPFLALRRLSAADRPAAYFLVSGNHWAYIADRPAAQQLPVVTPGDGGHPPDRGRVEPLAAAAQASGDRAALLAMLSMECHYGRVSGRTVDGTLACAETRLLSARGGLPDAGLAWQILLSTRPWREGTCFDTEPLGRRDGGWEVFHAHDLHLAPRGSQPPSVVDALAAVHLAPCGPASPEQSAQGERV